MLRPTPVLRFAPSPNGYLHLGHAYSALLNQAVARTLGGEVLLRIEDIDRTRSRPHYERALIEDLSWLGLRYAPPRRQSEHFEDYAAALAKLDRAGLVYPCFCSRSDVARQTVRQGRASRDPDGALVYPGACRHLGLDERSRRLACGELHTWRLNMDAAVAAEPDLLIPTFTPDGLEQDQAADPRTWGDVILARRDVPTSYHLSVVVDDALQEVTHVVRGADLAAATSIHRLLQAVLGLPTPRYHHHALVTDANGDKLAKSLAAPALRDLRADGISAEAIRVRLGFSKVA